MDSSSIYLPITARVRAGANPAEPADPPIINVITQRHRLAKPKELSECAWQLASQHIHGSVGKTSQPAVRDAFESQIEADNVR